jgi:membrane protease YdiL (CAAX protease family)
VFIFPGSFILSTLKNTFKKEQSHEDLIAVHEIQERISIMNNQRTLSTNQGVFRLFTANKRGYLFGLFAVFVPLVIVAEIGAMLGTDTSFAAALVINSAYVLALIIATAVLKAQGRGWRNLGLARPENWPKTLVFALGTLLVMIVALLGFQVIIMNIPGLALGPSNQSDYNPLTGNLPLYLIMVAASWTLIAFGEEMVFRAFLINSLAGALGNGKASWGLALVGSSLLFGLAHYDWGLAGILETFIAGLIFGGVYLRAGRNLWVPIIAHALIDTLKFSLIYAGWV